MLILVLMHKRICPILKWRFWGNHSQTRIFVLVRAHIIQIVILWCGEGTHISDFVLWRYNKSSNFDIWVLRENEVHLWTFGFDETTTISNFAFWVSMKQPIFQTLKLCFEGNTIASHFYTWISLWKKHERQLQQISSWHPLARQDFWVWGSGLDSDDHKPIQCSATEIKRWFFKCQRLVAVRRLCFFGFRCLRKDTALNCWYLSLSLAKHYQTYSCSPMSLDESTGRFALPLRPPRLRIWLII